jgi:hypothetical protein
MGTLGALITGALSGRLDLRGLAGEVTQFRKKFSTLRYVR